MTNTTAPDLPSIMDDTAKPKASKAKAKAATPRKPDPQAKPKNRLVESVATVEVPMLHGIEGYTKRGVDVRFNTHEQRETAKAVHFGLQRSNKRMKDGSEIRSWSDTVRWVFEQLSPEEGIQE